MIENFYYIFLLLPILALDVAIILFNKELLLSHKKTLIATVLFFSIPWYCIVDPLAVNIWKIWYYNTDKLLNIWILGTAIEELIWTILISFLFSALTIVLKAKQLTKTN